MQPLKGVKIIELGHIVAAPFATFILASMGAEVVKIEKPDGGDPARNYPEMGASIFLAYNAGKKSVTLDLKSSVGRQILLKLAEKADAIVENYSPGVLESLHLSYEDLRKVNPQIVYCSIKGFGPGPYRQRPAMEALVQSLSGFMSITGEPQGPPIRSPAPIMDCSCGMFAALAVVLALNVRRETGKGQKVEVALFETATLLMSLWLVYYAVYHTLPQRVGSGHLVWSPYGLFRAAAGEHVFIGVSSEKHWTLLCKALDLTSLAEDPEFQTMAKRVANRNKLAEKLEGALKSLNAADAVERLIKFGVPAAPLNTLDKVIDDEHLNRSKALFQTKLEDGTLLKLPLPPIYSDAAAPTLTSEPPKLGADTTTVLRSIGYSDRDISVLKRRGCI